MIEPPPLLNTKGCPSRCRCTCHNVRARRHSTQSIRAAIAPAASRVGQISFTNKCSIPECNAKKSWRGQLTYSVRFPSSLLNYILTFSILTDGLKFRSYLKLPVYVPEYSDVIRAATNGDLGTMKRLFDANLARTNDTGLDGWTILMVR
jgi:hypothetical protein